MIIKSKVKYQNEKYTAIHHSTTSTPTTRKNLNVHTSDMQGENRKVKIEHNTIPPHWKKERQKCLSIL